MAENAEKKKEKKTCPSGTITPTLVKYVNCYIGKRLLHGKAATLFEVLVFFYSSTTHAVPYVSRSNNRLSRKKNYESNS